MMGGVVRGEGLLGEVRRLRAGLGLCASDIALCRMCISENRMNRIQNCKSMVDVVADTSSIVL